MSEKDLGKPAIEPSPLSSFARDQNLFGQKLVENKTYPVGANLIEKKTRLLKLFCAIKTLMSLFNSKQKFLVESNNFQAN